MDIFLSFTNNNIKETYDRDYRMISAELYKNTSIQLFIFEILMIIYNYILLYQYHYDISFIRTDIRLILDSIIFVFLCTTITLLYYYNKKQPKPTKKIDLVSFALLTGLSIFEILMIVMINQIADNQIKNISRLLIIVKCIWKVDICSIFFVYFISKLFYTLQIIAISLVEIYIFIEHFNNLAIQLIYIITGYVLLFFILYNKGKIFKLIYIKNYTQKQLNDTLKFIIEEIPENILITDVKLNPTFFSNGFNYDNKCQNSSLALTIIKSVKDFKARPTLGSLSKDEEEINGAEICSIEFQQGFEIDENLQKNSDDSFTLKDFESKNKEGMTLYDLLLGKDRDKSSTIYDVLKTMKSKKQHESLIFDCKYQSSESKKPKSLELKVSLRYFGNEACMIFIFRDTTERDIIARLEDNNIYKERLLNSVTHELRTPLNGFLTMIESALEDCSVPENIKNKYLLPGMRSGKLLMNIINDILDFSQIMSNTLKLVFSPNKIGDTINHCVSLVEIQAKKKGLDLRLKIHPNVPEIFCTDHNRLTQILLNLLTNAIKFTYEGFVEIQVSIKLNHLQIAVQDSGIGIESDDIKEIFMPFNKMNLGKRFRLNSAGIGLGLLISNKLVKMLSPNGKHGLRIESKIGKGSKFSFILVEQNLSSPENEIHLKKLSSQTLQDYPEVNSKFNGIKSNANESISLLNEKNVEILRPRESIFYNQNCFGKRSSSASNSKILDNNNNLIPKTKSRRPTIQIQNNKCNCPSILIVDDDSFNILALETLLRKFNITSDSAFNGKIAIEKILYREKNPCMISCQPFKLIFMDCNMPVLDGFETTTILRGMIKTKEIQELLIIGCTSYTAKDKIEECINSGMNDVLSKPLYLSNLKKLLSKYVLLDNNFDNFA